MGRDKQVVMPKRKSQKQHASFPYKHKKQFVYIITIKPWQARNSPGEETYHGPYFLWRAAKDFILEQRQQDQLDNFANGHNTHKQIHHYKTDKIDTQDVPDRFRTLMLQNFPTSAFNT